MSYTERLKSPGRSPDKLSGGVDPLKCIAVVPRQPVVGVRGQLISMLLQFGEIVEGINVVQFTGVDQAHEQVSHASPVRGFIKVGVLTMEDSLFQGSFAHVVV